MGLKVSAATAGEELLSGAALARQWASADLFSGALGACLCAGGFHVPIDSAAVALDLLAYLEEKYASSDKAPLASFVKQAMTRTSHFGDWLASLDHSTLQAEDLATLMADLKTTLDTMSGSRGFACV